MSSEFEQNLEKYAEVVLKVGINLQKGQWLLITQSSLSTSLLDLVTFIEILVKKAYQLGASFVDVLWNNPQLHLIRLKHAPRNSFEEFSSWRRDASLENIEKGGARVEILASDPFFFNNQDPELVATMIQARIKKHKQVSDLMNQKKAINWCVVLASCDAWSEKVFPDLLPDKRIVKLWNKIFEICRINQHDPVSAWIDHINQLISRCFYLNNKNYSALHFSAPETDLTIGLPEEHKWIGGRLETKNGIFYTPNIPTEEIFTLPHKDMTEGIVKMTKPLNHKGHLIEDIKIRFSRGKVIELTAGKGKDFLDKIVKTNEGASNLGEIALVPHSSPISQTGLIFYNSLLDENASCHIALGFAYKSCLKNGEEMTDEEFMTAGGNISPIHIDFMFGSGEMDVDGITKDGKVEPVMQKGEWAFNI
ncbi:MAG: aminopeptidase [Candidatus Odinarchaeota archaeon]